MVTNSISEWGVPKWEFSNLLAHLHTGITIWKRWIHMGKHSHLRTFLSIFKWSQPLFHNRLVNEPSPYGNGHLSESISKWFLEMVWIPHLVIPIWKWGALCFEYHFHMGICCWLFPFGDPHMETGSRMFWFSIWKWWFTVSIWGFAIFRFPQMQKIIFSARDAPALVLVTQWMAKTTVPVSNLRFPNWDSLYGNGQVDEKNPMGTPCSKIEFVLIRGLTLYDKS